MAIIEFKRIRNIRLSSNALGSSGALVKEGGLVLHCIALSLSRADRLLSKFEAIGSRAFKVLFAFYL